MGHKRVAEILCRRDGITMDEAMKLIEQTADEIAYCSYTDEAEDVIASNLGLELDYLFDILEV